jgi:hypothetical protein
VKLGRTPGGKPLLRAEIHEAMRAATTAGKKKWRNCMEIEEVTDDVGWGLGLRVN